MANRTFARRQRMKKRWTRIPGTIFTMTADGHQGGASFSASEAVTVLRLLGEYIIGPTSPPVALDAVSIGVGIGVVSTDAATLGATALPDPEAEPDYPWLYWAVHDFYFPSTDVDAAGAQQSVRKVIDVKSMRKLTSRQSLSLMVDYTNVVGSPPMHMMGSPIRVLLAQ